MTRKELREAIDRADEALDALSVVTRADFEETLSEVLPDTARLLEAKDAGDLEG